MLSLSLGPLALSTAHLVLLLAVGAAMLIARRCAPAGAARHPDSTLFCLFVLGVVVARLGFVAAYWAQYRDTPWQAIDLRDAGFLPWLGVTAALSAALLRAWRAPFERRALGLGLAVGLAIWVLGGEMLHWQQQGSALPGPALVNAQGAPVSLAQAQGQPTVVNLWPPGAHRAGEKCPRWWPRRNTTPSCASST
jgi:hypothetical protein